MMRPAVRLTIGATAAGAALLAGLFALDPPPQPRKPVTARDTAPALPVLRTGQTAPLPVTAAGVGQFVIEGSGPHTLRVFEIETPLPAVGILLPGEVPLSGVRVLALRPGQHRTAYTDAEGRWSLTLPPGEWRVVPAKAGHYFAPPSRAVSAAAEKVIDSAGVQFRAYPMP